MNKCFPQVDVPHPYLLSTGLCIPTAYYGYGNECNSAYKFALPSLNINRWEVESPAAQLAGMKKMTPENRMKFVQPDYLLLLHNAYVTHDGPLFQRVMGAINTLMRLLKHPPLPASDIFAAPAPSVFEEAIRAWVHPSSVLYAPSGIPQQVVHRIINETYQRAVGPHTAELSRYEAFSSSVYGELLPPLISDIIRATRLSARSLLVDLGSGVGNVVLQASLQTGCRSFGVELMPAPARLARRQLEAFKGRCRMWGVSMGEVELEEGDMLESKRVAELIKEADVVLVNNKVFKESRECPILL